MADPLPIVSCGGTPAAGAPAAWRHGITSPLIVALGSPRHRGTDLITGAAATEQHVRGEVSYGALDKALEDEQVDLFACRAGAWAPLGSALTDSDGRFELTLSGAARLPLGVRPLYLSVAGDRSGAGFYAFVLPAGARIAVSDIDGTLTSSENAFPESLISGAAVGAHDGAAAALAALVARRTLVLYLTSRGGLFTQTTREWLARAGFPLGPLRLGPRLLTWPGEATAVYKADTMAAVRAAGLALSIGIGNRLSDGEAYRRSGIAPPSIFLKQPEFRAETEPLIARGEAVGFESYRTLLPIFSALPPGR